MYWFASGKKARPGRGSKRADAAHGLLRLIDGAAGAARDFRDAPLAQRVHEVAHDAIFERFLPAGAFELQQQTFAQVARTHARRIEGLDYFEDFGDFFRRQIGCRRHLFHRRLEVAVIINVANDQLRDAALLVQQVGVPRLVHQHLGEGGSHRERVEHELALFLLLGGLVDGNVRR